MNEAQSRMPPLRFDVLVNGDFGEDVFRICSYRKCVPAQAVDATLACSLLAGVWKPKVFLGR